LEQTTRRQRSLKLQSIEYKGSKCSKCGYDRYIGALEFHHLDPNEKDFYLSHAKMTSFEKVKSELDKCVLLCANCHREEHARLRGLIE
jgi:5-methylcytosine-specific restriction endonuclease McrA